MFGIGSSPSMVNTDSNCLFNNSALVLLSENSLPLSLIGDTPMLSCFFDYMNLQNGFGLLLSKLSSSVALMWFSWADRNAFCINLLCLRYLPHTSLLLVFLAFFSNLCFLLMFFLRDLVSHGTLKRVDDILDGMNLSIMLVMPSLKQDQLSFIDFVLMLALMLFDNARASCLMLSQFARWYLYICLCLGLL